MCELLINIIGTVIGGLLFTVILFFLNEHIFTTDNLTGEWNVTSVTEETSYNPYRNLQLFNTFHLLQKGHEIIGSGEKTKEITSSGTEQEYERGKRTLFKINGYYERKFLGQSKIYLNIIEDGLKRETRTTYILTVKNKNTLTGTFTSTAADSSGQIKMEKS